MRKKIYLIQPTYRLMDGALLKEFPLFNYSYNLPILSASIPPEWDKSVCLEYSDEVDFDSDASVIVIMSPGYDIDHAVGIALEFRKRKKIVVFGAHMDGLSDRLMKEVCDAVFYGYPTRHMMEMILEDAASGSIKPEYRCGMNIDFPFDYSVLRGKTMWFVPVIASLGCRYSCSYCCYPPVYGGRYRLRHIDNVVADLRSARSLRRPIAFLDANLYNNRTYLMMLCRRIIAEGLHIRWGGQCTIDVGDDPEVLALMREAGCHMLFFGLETLDQKNMVQLNKSFDTGRYAEQVARVRASGIHVAAFFMLGLDEDTRETFDRVYDFFRQTKIAMPYAHLLFPVPGTPLAQSLRAQDRVCVEVFDEFLANKPEYSVPCSFAYFTPQRLSAAELENGYLRLFERLTSIPQILKRCLVSNPFDAVIILMMNLEARRKCRAMAKAHEAKDAARVSHA